MGDALTALAAVVGLAICASPQPVAAAPTWDKPILIAHTKCHHSVATAFRFVQNTRGDAVAAWDERDCGASGRILAVSRSAGHPWGHVRVMASATTYWLQAALDARGGATLAWTPTPNDYFDNAAKVIVATRSPGGSFGKPRVIDRHGEDPVLAANASGETVLAWQHLFTPVTVPTGHAGVVVAAIREPNAARFAPPQTLSSRLVLIQNEFGGHSPVSAEIQAAIAPDGAAVASWTRTDGTTSDCCTSVEAALRLPGRRFGSPIPVSAPRRYQQPEPSVVAIANARDAIVAWTTGNTKADASGTVSASRWDGQAFQAPTALMRTDEQPPGTFFFDLHVLLSALGTATLSWDLPEGCLPGVNYVIATLPPAGPSGSPERATPSGLTVGAFAAALDTQDRVVTVWSGGTTVETDRYGNCQFKPANLSLSIDNGPTIGGPRSGPKTFDAAAFTAAPGPPTVTWQTHDRLYMMTLSQANVTQRPTPAS